MGDSEDSQGAAAGDDLRRVDLPDDANQAEDAARVARAAAELGVAVPDGFFLTGVDDSGKYTAFMSGNSNDFKISAAILRRINGGSVAEIEQSMSQEPQEDAGPRPEWWPPDDWNDKEAWEAWMAERARHPEWPDVYNGPGDWLPMLLTGTGITAVAAATASHMNLRARIGFAKWLVRRAEERGLHPDPVAVLRAFEHATPEPTAGPDAQAGDTEVSARPPNDGEQSKE